MPLTDEQKTALTTLVVADPKEVAEALQKESANHYQTIYQKGFSTAHNESKTKLEEKEAEIEAEKAKIKAKDDELVQLREKSPDAEKVRLEYEEKLAAKEAEKKEAIEAADKKVEDLHASRFDAELAGALVAAGVEPDYAKEVLVPKYRNRRKVEKDGTVKFYDDDGSTPLAAVNGELPRVAAEKIKGTVDPKWILSNADKGAGSQGGSDKGGANKFDAMRKMGQKLSTENGTSNKVAEKIGLA